MTELDLTATTTKERVTSPSFSKNEKPMTTTITLPTKIVTSEMIANIGKDTNAGVATITNRMLELQKASDAGALGDKISELLDASRSMSSDNFKAGPLKKVINRVLRLKDNAVSRFQTAQDKVQQLVRTYEIERQGELKNIQNIADLSKANYELCKSLITRIEQYEEVIPLIEEEITAYGDDSSVLTFEQSKALSDARSRLDDVTKKRNDAQTLKILSMQADPSIEQMKASSVVVIQELDNITQNIIPAYGIFFMKYLLARQTESRLNLIKKSKEHTKELIEMSGQLSAQNAINSARMTQEAFIDIETVRKDHETMVNSLAEVKKIQEEGRKRRSEVFVELKTLEQKTIEVFSKR